MSTQFSLHHGDLFDVLKTLPAESLDACVTDPPYGIRFMGKAWDGADIIKKTEERMGCAGDPSKRAGDNGGHRSIAAEAGKYNRSTDANRAFEEWSEAWAREVFRVLKPGAHLVSFASCRTYHRMVSGIENAGFEIRDQLAWVFGSGFPKSSNQSDEWEGWGTALKPAWEPIVLARRPFEGTVPENLAEHRTGALNIDGCRIAGGLGGTRDGEKSRSKRYTENGSTNFAATPGPRGGDAKGRWPANLCHDGSAEVVAHFPAEAGAAAPVTTRKACKTKYAFGNFAGNRSEAGTSFHGDTGTAARFFYCAKASAKDRDMGLEDMALAAGQAWDPTSAKGKEHAEKGWGEKRNVHPTVKPTELMRWLCRMITPPGGTILDPFTGSGSTGRAAVMEGFQFVGIEREADYIPIARARINDAVGSLFVTS